MLERWSHLACALATGLLLQIAVQIRALHWLPDFPIYIALALLAGAAAICGVGAPFRNRSIVGAVLGVVFLICAEGHAALALSESLAMERWRDLILWPALICGLA